MILVWTPAALRDRDHHDRRMAMDSPRAAIAPVDLVLPQIEALLDDPELGRRRRVQGTRELVIARTSFVVIYRVRPKQQRTEILRLLHGAQQWPPLPEG